VWDRGVSNVADESECQTHAQLIRPTGKVH